jgi:23S rRNA (pseudouridine1915-N3)-methyltransferase
MLKIKVIAIGKIKDSSYKLLISEYSKRLSPYSKIDIIELDAGSFKNDSQKEKVKKEEGEKFLKIIEKNMDSRIILLDEGGEVFNSVEFSEFLNYDTREVIFLIAGTLGFSEEVKSRVPKKFSLTRLTLPHEMARVILFEQLFRAVTIETGKKYHY